MTNISLEREKLKKELLLHKGLFRLEDKYTSRMTDQLLFNTNKDHSKIFALDKIYLSKIDFTDISFDNFNAEFYNFKGLNNITLDINHLYNKSLCGAILYGVTISGSYKDVYIKGANFQGAKGNLSINPQELKYKDLSYCILNGVRFTNKFDNTNIMHTDFRGSANAIINPQRLKRVPIDSRYPEYTYIQMNNCVFDNVYFEGSFKNADVRNSDFTRSKGKINLNNVFLTSKETNVRKAEYKKKVKLFN